jgi:site-specific DNA-cytosine methylase
VRAAGYPGSFLPPRAAERERQRWSKWKSRYRQSGQRISVQTCPDHFLSSSRERLVAAASADRPCRRASREGNMEALLVTNSGVNWS